MTFILSIITPLFPLSKMGLKALAAYGVPILLGIFVIKMTVKESVLLIGTGVTLLLVSELIVMQLGSFFSKEIDFSKKVSYFRRFI